MPRVHAGQLGRARHEYSVRTAVQPVLHQVVARRLAFAAAGGTEEFDPAAAEDDVQPVADVEVHELPGDIPAAGIPVRGGHEPVALPVAFGRMGVDGRGGRVGDARGRHDARRLAVLFGEFAHRRHRYAQSRPAVSAVCLGPDVDDAGPGLLAGLHRRARARGVADLLIGVVGLDQCEVGEGLERQRVLLARLPFQLSVVDTRGRDRRHAHAVADEQDDVFRNACVRSEVDAARQRRIKRRGRRGAAGAGDQHQGDDRERDRSCRVRQQQPTFHVPTGSPRAAYGARPCRN